MNDRGRFQSLGPGQIGRWLEVTRVGTRNNPVRDDNVDPDLVPSNLKVNMNDRRRFRETYAGGQDGGIQEQGSSGRCTEASTR